MLSITSIKKLLFKSVAIFTAALMGMCCFLVNFEHSSLKASAEGLLQYDPSLGEYYFENGSLTAVPYENAGFRGWYNKSGEEVSVKSEWKLPSGADKKDYNPVF